MLRSTTRFGASHGNGAILGFEQQIWAAADKMRRSMHPPDNLCIISPFPHSTAQKNTRGSLPVSHVAASHTSRNRSSNDTLFGAYLRRCPKCIKHSFFKDYSASGLSLM